MESLILELTQRLQNDEEIFLRIKVHPKAPRTEIYDQLDDGTIKVRVKAVPEKGKANKELIRYLAKTFLVPKDQIVLLSGHTDPLKLIKITT